MEKGKKGSNMQEGKVLGPKLGAWLMIALFAVPTGVPEASSETGIAPALRSSPESGFRARRSPGIDRRGTPHLMALRLRKARDTDGDGVEDRDDVCPDTPVSAIVDAQGCPTDTDQDGVFDGLDQCANTAQGATVDTAGCPRDSDGDGLLDGLDMCPDTDTRALVNEDGCPYDSDGDGLLEGIDQCPGTPMGAIVDERGCRVDADGDGVADGLDRCPDTSLEDDADESGCSRVQRGEFVLPAIRFGLGSAKIVPGSSPALDRVASILRQNPHITVEIGGHTDTTGPAKRNRKISLKRAEEVKAYLVSQGVPASRMTTRGYGEVHPIASNRYEQGRAKNRRIEFKILPPTTDP
jgi:OOP family OmpA-OmpF porin